MNFYLGQRVRWKSGGYEVIYGWRESEDIKNRYEIQLRPNGPFWSTWFFNFELDGNDILKEMVNK